MVMVSNRRLISLHDFVLDLWTLFHACIKEEFAFLKSAEDNLQLDI